MCFPSRGLCRVHFLYEWKLDMCSSSFVQFQLQMFDIICSLSWISRDKCCDLPATVSVVFRRASKRTLDTEHLDVHARVIVANSLY